MASRQSKPAAEIAWVTTPMGLPEASISPATGARSHRRPGPSRRTPGRRAAFQDGPDVRVRRFRFGLRLRRALWRENRIDLIGSDRASTMFVRSGSGGFTMGSNEREAGSFGFVRPFGENGSGRRGKGHERELRELLERALAPSFPALQPSLRPRRLTSGFEFIAGRVVIEEVVDGVAALHATPEGVSAPRRDGDAARRSARRGRRPRARAAFRG